MAEGAFHRFYGELKRRKVTRVAIAYIVVAWLVVEAASVLFPQLLLPAWSVRLVLALAIIGFPIAVVLAWAVDVTPQGIRSDTGPASPASTPAPAAANRDQVLPAGEEQPDHQDLRSIAVLPLLNLSNDPENEYFSDGMAEEVLNRLCKLPQLTVASRTSSFSFKGKDVDLRSVAEKLGVDAILEGSVRRAGGRVRITAQLIHGRSDRHLWSETYDRDLEDIFSVQDEIARRIVDALAIQLTPRQQRALSRDQTTASLEAYDFYLRGRHYFWRGDMHFAQQTFEKAIDLDPFYALAWAGLADAHSWSCMWIERTPAHLRGADEASRKALELAPQLAEAHAARGFALSLNDRYDEAASLFRKAIELDPQLFESYYYAGRSHFAAGRFREAADMFDKAAQVRPDDVAAVTLRSTALRSLGEAEASREAAAHAIQVIERHLQLHPDDALALSRGANTLIEVGETGKGLEWAEQAYALNPRVCGYNVACAYVMAGEYDRALDVLDEHIRTSGVHRHWLENDSDWNSLRDHPRFQAILARLG